MFLRPTMAIRQVAIGNCRQVYAKFEWARIILQYLGGSIIKRHIIYDDNYQG